MGYFHVTFHQKLLESVWKHIRAFKELTGVLDFIAVSRTVLFSYPSWSLEIATAAYSTSGFLALQGSGSVMYYGLVLLDNCKLNNK